VSAKRVRPQIRLKKIPGIRRKGMGVFVFTLLPIVFVGVISYVSLVGYLESAHLSRIQAEQGELKSRYERRAELCRQKWPLKGSNYESCVYRIIR
jgi:hypothetical protein